MERYILNWWISIRDVTAAWVKINARRVLCDADSNFSVLLLFAGPCTIFFKQQRRLKWWNHWRKSKSSNVQFVFFFWAREIISVGVGCYSCSSVCLWFRLSSITSFVASLSITTGLCSISPNSINSRFMVALVWQQTSWSRLYDADVL